MSGLRSFLRRARGAVRPSQGDGEALSGGPPPAGTGGRSLGLSAKLLGLTIVFVMLAEVLIFVPSVANFRNNWLMERLLTAQAAALAAEAAPEGRVPQALRDELLETARVRAVALKRAEARQPVLQDDMPPDFEESFDLRGASAYQLIVDALSVFLRTSDRAIRVVGKPTAGTAEFVEIVMMEQPLRTAMIAFGLRILGLSVVIAVIAAAMLYVVLNRMLVRPIEHMARTMMRFSENPEDTGRIITPSARTDEIGTAERELAHMQSELAQMLHQKSRLAALGLAISKINHDLRGMLANAQLISDRFQGSQDPTVQRFAPKLIGSLDRAIRLCTDTLRFGRAEEEPPKRAGFALRGLVDEVGEGLGLPRGREIGWVVDIDADLMLDADPDQIFRVLTNLSRNALQALDAHIETGGAARGTIAVRARPNGSATVIEVADDGPGIPARAREHLFEAFQGSARKGGTGLGLVIAAEIVRAHGGSLRLAEADKGTRFEILIPNMQGD